MLKTRLLVVGLLVASFVSWSAIGAAATAVSCKDGRTGPAGKGACARHGGVAMWMTGS